MTTAERRATPKEPLDDELTAYHEAGHAVAMWKLGFGVERVTIEPEGNLRGTAEPASTYAVAANADIRTRRFVVEQNVLYLHAGDVAARLLRPDVGLGQAGVDHRSIHDWMYTVEDDGSIHITWCNHLWQRAYAFLSWPGQWYLVIGLAQQLLAHRTLVRPEVERYLRQAAARLKHDPRMPNAVLIGEVTYVCSPWHRKWHEQSVATMHQPRRTEMPETIADLIARADVRAIKDVLAPLSGRARNVLARADVQTVIDFEDWSPRALRCIRAAGDKTVQEIVDAAARVGVRMAPDEAPYPWESDPARWRSR